MFEAFFLLAIWGAVIYFAATALGRVKRQERSELNLTVVNGSHHGHRCFVEHLDGAERVVVNQLVRGLSHKEYFIFNNLIIPSNHSVSTEIDHIVVSVYGIFVIETKNYNGWIYPHASREMWTATYQNGSKYHFKNPLWQNYGHIEALKRLMPFVENNFINVVVFVGETNFKVRPPDGVLYDYQLVTYISGFKKQALSQQRLLMTIGKLSYLCQATDFSREEHVQNISKLIDSVSNEKSYG